MDAGEVEERLAGLDFKVPPDELADLPPEDLERVVAEARDFLDGLAPPPEAAAPARVESPRLEALLDGMPEDAVVLLDWLGTVDASGLTDEERAAFWARVQEVSDGVSPADEVPVGVPAVVDDRHGGWVDPRGLVYSFSKAMRHKPTVCVLAALHPELGRLTHLPQPRLYERLFRLGWLRWWGGTLYADLYDPRGSSNYLGVQYYSDHERRVAAFVRKLSHPFDGLVLERGGPDWAGTVEQYLRQRETHDG